MAPPPVIMMPWTVNRLTTTLMCGGHYKESGYQMHDCKSANAKPLKPWEHMGIRIELAGRDGIKFHVGADAAPPEGSDLDKVLKVAGRRRTSWLPAFLPFFTCSFLFVQKMCLCFVGCLCGGCVF